MCVRENGRKKAAGRKWKEESGCRCVKGQTCGRVRKRIRSLIYIFIYIYIYMYAHIYAQDEILRI